MQIERCSRGHYYDKEIHAVCPFCAEDQISHIDQEPQSAGDSSFSEHHDHENGTQVLSDNGYELIEKLGKGATSRVLKVRRIRDNRIWAAKEIKKGLDLKLQYTIRQEASLLNQIFHPNIGVESHF